MTFAETTTSQSYYTTYSFLITLRKRVPSSLETSVTNYQPTRCHISEDCNVYNWIGLKIKLCVNWVQPTES